jgi:hypothetical protein
VALPLPFLAEHRRVEFKFYDIEAFSGRCSDVAILETDSLEE